MGLPTQMPLTVLNNLFLLLIAVIVPFDYWEVIDQTFSSSLSMTMNTDSVVVFKHRVAKEDITPHMDQFKAADGMRFEYAHVMVGNSYPGRNVMFTGRTSHSNLVEGFYAIRNPHYPHLVDLMKEGGYFTGIFGKVGHTTPYYPYPWDLVIGEGEEKKDYHFKDADAYFRSTARGIKAAKKADKPFCLLINISDPHLPFYKWNRPIITCNGGGSKLIYYYAQNE